MFMRSAALGRRLPLSASKTDLRRTMNHDQGWMPLRWLLCERLRPYVVPAAAAAMIMNLALAIPAVYLLQVFDRVLSSRSTETLAMLTLLAFAALGLSFCMDRVRAALLTQAARAVDETLAPAALKAALADAARGLDNGTPSVIHDVARLRSFLTGPAIHALLDAPWLPVYLLLIHALHPVLGIAAAASAAGLFAVGALTERVLRPRSQAASNHAKAAGLHADVLLRHAELVAGSGAADAAMRLWRRLHEQVLSSQQRLGDASSALGACGRTLRQGVQVALTGLGAWLVVAGEASPGVMVAATVLLARALHPVEHLIAGWGTVLDARAAWRRLAQQAVDAPGRRAPCLPPARGELVLQSVTYCAGATRVPVVRNVSLRVAGGECLGVIGPSGSGKTTLVRLMLGLRQPALGSARLDGVDVSLCAQELFAGALGYLPQDARLLDGTVAQNIARWAGVDADDAASRQVIDAAIQAGAHESILRLPLGYETPVGESGLPLSGGLQQRIALARALYGRPRLVVLDEPGVQLDDDAEHGLLAAVESLKRAGTAVVLVSHRPSLMRHADRLAVLRDGALDLCGPRDEVLARLAQGNVRRLHQRQASACAASQGASA
jgi:PrtD family type I secretion system ABC transporter